MSALKTHHKSSYLRLYWEFARRSFQRHLTYRAAAFAGLLTNFFFGLLRVAVLLALFADRQEVAGFTRPGLYTYMALSQGIISLIHMFGWYELMDAVHSGEIAGDLLKPLGLFHVWLARDGGRAAATFLLRGVTIVGLYALFFPMQHPQSARQWAAVGLALLLGWLSSFAWRFLINLAAFWTPNARGIGRLGFVAANFFSGFLMPLSFFPQWVQTLAYLTPFPYMLNSIVEIYLGILHGAAFWQAMAIELLWIGILFALSQLLLRAGVRRLVILGG